MGGAQEARGLHWVVAGRQHQGHRGDDHAEHRDHAAGRRTRGKGVPIPPEMFQKTEPECMADGKPKRPRNDLRTGLMFAGIGIGVVMLTGKPGYIILFMGVAFIVASFFEKKNDNDSQPPKI